MVKPDKPIGWGAATPLIWVDVETTGLDPLKGCLLEVALIVTEPAPTLTIIDAASVLVRPVVDGFNVDDPDIDKNVPDFHLGEGGLLELAWHEGMAVADAVTWLNGWLTSATSNGTGVLGPMCGSSVAFDRGWLTEHMPDLLDWWTYRNLDVSAMREWLTQIRRTNHLASFGSNVNEWISYGKTLGPEHRAEPDLRRSIHMLQKMSKEVR